MTPAIRLGLRNLLNPRTVAAALAAPPDASTTSSAGARVRPAMSQVEQAKSWAFMPS